MILLLMIMGEEMMDELKGPNLVIGNRVETSELRQRSVAEMGLCASGFVLRRGDFA